MNISYRLNALCKMVPVCRCLCDIGTDHGYVPCKVVMDGKASNAIAMDINKGPLKKAEENIRKYGLSDRIQIRLSNGMRELKYGEADVIVISGMGGPLMQNILTADMDKISENMILILQPQSELREFRRYLHNNGFIIKDEQLIQDEGKYYSAMLCIKGIESYDNELFYYTGKAPLESRSSILKDYLLKKERSLKYLNIRLKKADSDKAEVRNRHISEELNLIRKALLYYENR